MIWQVDVMIVAEMGDSGNCCTGWVPVVNSDLTLMAQDAIERNSSFWSGGGT
jgi:hypothetical protein